MPTHVLQKRCSRVAEMKAITADAAMGVSSHTPARNCDARRGRSHPPKSAYAENAVKNANAPTAKSATGTPPQYVSRRIAAYGRYIATLHAFSAAFSGGMPWDEAAVDVVDWRSRCCA